MKAYGLKREGSKGEYNFAKLKFEIYHKFVIFVQNVKAITIRYIKSTIEVIQGHFQSLMKDNGSKVECFLGNT